jgi:hypothetical protein
MNQPDNATLMMQAVDAVRCLGRPLVSADDIFQQFGV